MRMCWAIVVAVLLTLVLTVRADEPSAADLERVEQGRRLYEIYCRSCHGDDADGHSRRAETLSPPPADLTRLRAADGTFPAERIHRTIDGRDPLPGHRRKEMPIWGLTLQELDRDADQEDEVRRKIGSIVDYLESIQRE